MLQQSSTVQKEQNQINQSEIRLLMPQGIIGFHDLRHYAFNPIMNGERSSPFWLLKSHECQEIAFILLERKAIRDRIVLDWEDVDVAASKYGINLQTCELFFITTIDRSKDAKKHITVNLCAPVLIDFAQKHAWQVILSGSKYPIDYNL